MSVHILPHLSFALAEEPKSVIQIFRMLDLFRQDYRPEHLQKAVDRLAQRLDKAAAETVVSEAVMVDNELRLRAFGRFEFSAYDAPTASSDEAALLAVIAAVQRCDYACAAQAAVSLDILKSRMLLTLIYRLARSLTEAGITLKAPFRGRAAAPRRPMPARRLSRGDLRVV